MAGRLGFGAYLKAAFATKWNLLFFGAAGVAGLISGRPDVALPIVLAGEVLWLVGAASSERFQRHVDAVAGAARSQADLVVLQKRFDQLFYGLSYQHQKRFEELRGRCEILRDLSVRDAAARGSGLDLVARAQLDGVNRLLWVYLKLLHTKQLLEGFLQSTDEGDMARKLEEVEKRLAELPEGTADGLAAKKRKTLEDTRVTLAARRDNLQRAKERFEFVNLELERIGAKLAGIAEVAVNRSDPDALTHDVDDVARSVEATEQAIGELQAITGLGAEDVAAPEILAPQGVRASS